MRITSSYSALSEQTLEVGRGRRSGVAPLPLVTEPQLTAGHAEIGVAALYAIQERGMTSHMSRPESSMLGRQNCKNSLRGSAPGVQYPSAQPAPLSFNR